MALVIAVLNNKGGSGKPTIATNLARGLQLEGYAPRLWTSDPQGTAQQWSDMQAEGSTEGSTEGMPGMIGVTQATLERYLPELSASFNCIVIDGAAKLHRRRR